MATNEADSEQVAALLKEAIAVLQDSLKRSDLPAEHRPGLRRTLAVLRRQLSKVETCRHRESKTRRRCLRTAVGALLDLISEIHRP